MKSSLGLLRKFALHKGDVKEKKRCPTSAILDELADAAQDMQNMRDCYDSLLAAAAETANSAHEISESLKEMGAWLIEKSSVHVDDKNDGILLMLGKVQFELQKLVDSYRSHIFLTITTPSESLLNELQTLEEMKRQCDEKRNAYEYMMEQHREKGRSKYGKRETFTAQQLQAAHNEYDEEATLCVFRLKSLKQGQPLSLSTQAVRHHAAQLDFFRKGLRSLEAVEPYIRLFTEQQHIEYQLNGPEDDILEGGECRDDGDLDTDDDQLQVSSPQPKLGSYSAPILAEKKFDQPLSRRKFHAYALPTPVGVKRRTPARTCTLTPLTMLLSPSGHTSNLWHSTPLEPSWHKKDGGDDDFSGSLIFRGQHSRKDGSMKNSFSQQLLPPPGSQKPKGHAFSVPLTKNSKPILSSSGPMAAAEPHRVVSGFHVTSPCDALLPPLSPPRISELHVLPRPPPAAKETSILGGLAAPARKRVPPALFAVASPLPTPVQPPGEWATTVEAVGGPSRSPQRLPSPKGVSLESLRPSIPAVVSHSSEMGSGWDLRLVTVSS